MTGVGEGPWASSAAPCHGAIDRDGQLSLVHCKGHGTFRSSPTNRSDLPKEMNQESSLLLSCVPAPLHA
jgi:hypothetical protein